MHKLLPLTSAGNILAAAALLAALAGCASAPSTPESAAGRASPRQAAKATEVAVAMVGKPYRYGGATPAGFDCSGLVSFSYGRAGIDISRETRSLRSQSMLVRAADLRRGDLLFFDQEGKKYSHVGLYLGDGRFVHAPSSGGRVRIDRLDVEYWQRHFVEARRI
jgi:cell wall-associated NlpC family hydrolase